MTAVTNESPTQEQLTAAFDHIMTAVLNTGLPGTERMWVCRRVIREFVDLGWNRQADTAVRTDDWFDEAFKREQQRVSEAGTEAPRDDPADGQRAEGRVPAAGPTPVRRGSRPRGRQGE